MQAMAHRSLVPALCAIAVALGGCSERATAPGGQGRFYSAAIIDQCSRLYTCQGLNPCSPSNVCGVASKVELDTCDEPSGCSCFTDYFSKTGKRPWCTALDWLVVLPVVILSLPVLAPGL
jgi:hypothetical protein